MVFKSMIQITFLDGSTATHLNKIADGLVADYEYGEHHVVRHKDASLFVGYPRKSICSVVYNKLR